MSKVDLLAILPYFVSFVMEELKVTLPYDTDIDKDKVKGKDKGRGGEKNDKDNYSNKDKM